MPSYQTDFANRFMTLRRFSRVSALLVVMIAACVALAGLVMQGSAAAQADRSNAAPELAAESCQPWAEVSTPHPRTHHYLRDVAVIAADDIWAVGQYYDENNPSPDSALAMHWNGAEWSIVTTPAIPGGATLNGVAAVNTNDVWAVGDCPSCASTSLTLHWDGLTWTRVASPSPVGTVTLNDVVAFAPNNVWAVGANDGQHSTVTMKWDGSAWSLVPSPNGGMFGDDNVLDAIDGVSANDMWAVGYIYPKGGSPKSLAMHWNGSNWTMSSTPNPGAYFTELLGVTAIAANDVWVVGSYSNDSGKTYLPLFMHWNGSAWSHVAGPEFPDYSMLEDVYAAGPNDVWAVGTNAECNFCFFDSLTMHYDGTSWTRVDSPNGFRDFTRLYGVAAVSSNDVWAVGFTDDLAYPYYSNAFAMRKVCPVPTPTGTPPTATGTRTQLPTYTPTATQTVAATPTCNPYGLRVLIVYADYTSPPNNLANGIRSNPGVQVVDFYRADTTTPPYQLLTQYDVVVAIANLTVYADPVTLGNRLADYEDAHGIVVAFHHTWDGSLREVKGRWQTGQYTPFQPYGALVYQDASLGTHNASHPLMQGVSNLMAFYRGNPLLTPGAELVASWTDGTPMIATKGRAVGVTAYVGDADGGWSGDFGRIVYNAGIWLRPGSCGTAIPTPTAGSPTATGTGTNTRTATPTSTPGTPPSCTVAAFAPDVRYAVDADPERIATGDFNHDERPDIAVANQNSATVSVLLNNGNGTMQAATTYNLDTQPHGITVGDYNRDGNLDIAVSSYGTKMAVILLGNAQGGFGTATGYGSGSNGAGISTADFNHDSAPDLVIADSGHDTMLVLLNNGSGGFGAGTSYDLDWIPSDVAVGDFNRDGNMDVAASNEFSDDVSVRLGTATGTFGAVQNYGVGAAPESILVGDFNNDNNPDFATSSGDNGKISVRLGNGSGGFAAPAHYPAGNGSMSIGQGDFNNDGKIDLAAASAPGSLVVLLGNGNGTFGGPQTFDVGSGPVAVAVADFNGDSRPDVAVSNNASNNVSVLINSCAAPATPTSVPPTATVGTATPQPSSTGVMSATATGSVVATSTGTPVVCDVTFTDVPVDHTFYSYIRCLACRGIVAGYPDGTFRPGNDVTRGQLSKIVANSAGYAEDPGVPIYADVAPGSAFYDFVQRLSIHGVISGYVCGGIGEPCDGESRPYFRPASSATRGQIAKIVSNAAGYSEEHTEQTFEDVPVGNTFYQFVQRLSSRGIVGGYACGSVPSEGCVPPLNRSYFRPGANTTRGQLSKIAAITFFPDCPLQDRK